MQFVEICVRITYNISIRREDQHEFHLCQRGLFMLLSRDAHMTPSARLSCVLPPKRSSVFFKDGRQHDLPRAPGGFSHMWSHAVLTRESFPAGCRWSQWSPPTCRTSDQGSPSEERSTWLAFWNLSPNPSVHVQLDIGPLVPFWKALNGDRCVFIELWNINNPVVYTETSLFVAETQ